MKQLKGIFCDIKRWLSSLNAKKIVIIALAAALIIAPTALAAAYVFYYEFLQTDDYFSVTLYDDSGTVIAEERENPESAGHSSLTGIFFELLDEASPSSSAQEPSDTDNYVRAVTDYKGESSELRCYFSADTAEGYYLTSDEKSYVIPERLNSAFLSTSYAEIFYMSSKCPSLVTIDHDIITPKSTKWYYKNASDGYAAATRNTHTDKARTYEITGAIDMSFEKAPDITLVRVYNGDKLIHTGTVEELPSLTQDTHDELRIYIEAQWIKTDGADSYGELVYDFSVRVKNRSAFLVSAETVRTGGYITLDCTNVTDISKISFSCSRNGYMPMFRSYNSLSRTVIPFPEGLGEESFDFTVSYGAASQSFSIKVLPNEATEEFSYSSLTFEKEGTPSLRNQSVRSAIFSTPLPQNELVYFRGNFSSPTDSGFAAAYTHGSTVRWGEELEYSYIALGNEYISVSGAVGGSSVCALQNGVVAYVGHNEWLGNYIVIDHGCGLRTWYTGLGKIDVESGELLLSGQHIGKAAVGSFEGREGFILYCTVYDTIIDPSSLWNK